MVENPVADPSASRRVMIFANPIAGRGRGERMAQEIQTRLKADGYDTQLFLKKAADVPADEVSAPCRAMVIIGGDGTLRATLQRVLDAGKLPPVIPVPLGTANMMAKYLNINFTDEDLAPRVAAAVASPRFRPLEAGRANGKMFIQVAGVGFDACLVQYLDERRRGPITPFSYTMPALLALRDFHPHRIHVVCNGVEVFPEQPGMALVGNIPQYGAGFPVLVNAQADDNLLDLFVVPVRSRIELIKMFLTAASGEHLRAEGVVYLKGTHFQISAPQPVPLQIDGDPAGTTPVSIDLLPVKIPFIVP